MRIPLIAVAAALVLAGCINNAQPQPVTTPITQTAGGAANNTTGTVQQYLPPVARMQVFDVGGALAYEANFVADNVTSPNAVQGGGPVRFVGAGSEAVDKTASVVQWYWDFGDGGRAVGRSATHNFSDTGGIFKVVLTVLDSHGLSDSQQVTLGVHATRVFKDATIAFKGALQLGTGGNLLQDGVDSATHKLELPNTLNGYAVRVLGLKLNLTPGEPTSDFDFFLKDGDKTVASGANGPADLGGVEVINAGPSEVHNGTYTLQVVLFLGANGTYTIAGEATYKVVNADVERQFGG